MLPPAARERRWAIGARALLCAVLALSTGPLLAAQGAQAEPTLEEVAAAVDDYFADDEAAKAASHANLRQWGDAALPHLRTLADEPSSMPRIMPFAALSMIGDLELVSAIDDIGSDAAIDLLLDIAENRTGVDPARGLGELETGADYKYEERLKAEPRFKKLVIRATLDRGGPFSQLERASAARTIGKMGWTDATEIVEAMARDQNLDVAESAAQAVFELTGERIEIQRPPLAFPGRLAGAPPLSAPREMPRTRRPLQFGFWRDGRDGLLVSGERTFEVSLVGPDGQVVATRETSEPVVTLLSHRTPAGEGRWIVATATDGFGTKWRRVTATDWEGTTLWEYEPRSVGGASLAVLYDEAGACGVALSEAYRGGVVAYDNDGGERFKTHAARGGSLRTHPLLPGCLLVLGVDIVLLDAEGRPTTLSRMQIGPKPRGPFFAADEACLFPDAEGRPAIIASGKRMSMEPVIVRLDHELVEIWSATVPGDIGGLALLEPEGRPRIFAAACQTGELYLFDENGAAYEPVRLVDDLEPGQQMWVNSMSAGRFDDGAWGVVVALIGRTKLFVLE